MSKKGPLRREVSCPLLDQCSNPFRFAAPFVLTAKKILQDLCKMKSGWDKEIPLEYNVRWQKWLIDLPMLSKLAIDHCFKPANFGTIAYSQLHHFSDASEIGFGSVSYLRLVDINDRVHCAILLGKSQLAPLKKFYYSSIRAFSSNSVDAVRQSHKESARTPTYRAISFLDG